MKLSQKHTYIYILYDPTFISQKFYVGKTEQPPKKRLGGHLKPSNLRRNYFSINWIKSLLARNIKPAMHIVAVIPPLHDWETAEKTLISFLRWCKIEVVNLTEGGEHGRPSGWHHTEESKHKMSLAKKGKDTWNKGLSIGQGEQNNFYGKKHSDETRKIISEKIKAIQSKKRHS